MLKGGEARLKAGQVAERKAADKKAGDLAVVEPPKGPAKKPGTLDWSKARPAAEKDKSATKKASEAPAAAKKGADRKRAVLSDAEDDDDGEEPEALAAKKPPVSVARPAAAPAEPKKKITPPAPAAATSKEERERVAKQKAELAGLFDADSDDETAGKFLASACDMLDELQRLTRITLFRRSAGSRSKGKRKAVAVSDDDDNDDEEATTEIVSPPPKRAPVPRKKPAAAAAAKGGKADKAEPGPVVRNAEGKVRRTRRVIRSEMTMNKRGFMVTEDVSDVESYCALSIFLSTALLSRVCVCVSPG